MSSAQKNDSRLSWQDQLAEVQGKVPEAPAEVIVQEVVSKEETAPVTALPAVVPVVAEESKPHAKQHQHHKVHTPKPVAAPQPEVKAVAQNVEREERPIVQLRLGELRHIDLALRVRTDKAVGNRVQFLLRKGSSTALFNLSYVGLRVRLVAHEATGEFATVFRKGTELFQDEIYGVKEVPPHHLAATTVFQEVLRFVEIREFVRRAQVAQVIPVVPVNNKRQPGFRGKSAGPRQHRVMHDAAK